MVSSRSNRHFEERGQACGAYKNIQFLIACVEVPRCGHFSRSDPPVHFSNFEISKFRVFKSSNFRFSNFKFSNLKSQNFKVSQFHFFFRFSNFGFANFRITRLGFNFGVPKKHKVATKTVPYERYGEILFQKVAPCYLLHFVQDGSSKNAL